MTDHPRPVPARRDPAASAIMSAQAELAWWWYEHTPRADTEYEPNLHAPWWRLDTRLPISERGALLRDVLRAVGCTGTVFDLTDLAREEHAAVRIEIGGAHWLDVECLASDAFLPAAPGMDAIDRLDPLAMVHTVMTTHPDDGRYDRVHRVERWFSSTDDDPPLPRGHQFRGGPAGTRDSWIDTGEARAVRTILRAVWETCFQMDLIGMFSERFWGVAWDEVNLADLHTEVVDGKRWFALVLEYERWTDPCLVLEFPLVGEELVVRAGPSAPLDVDAPWEQFHRELAVVLGTSVPSDRAAPDGADDLVHELQELARDAYHGAVLHAAFRPEARG